jgi:ABC-type transport system involved in multi-copper enzyme maturation permease subunit
VKWLIWKEYGLNRAILIVGVLLLIAPHLNAPIGAWMEGGQSAGQWISSSWRNLGGTAVFSLAMSQLTLCLLGANAIAGERVDRSAEFLAYLPLSRLRILAGKLALVFLTAALIWGLNLLLISFATPEVWQLENRAADTGRKALAGIAVTGLVFFSAGWLLSSLLESPTFPLFGGLLAPAVILLGIRAAAWAFDYHFHDIAWEWYWRTCPLLAVVCFVAGVQHYLRRIEP